MYPGQHAERNPDRPAVIMAPSGVRISYREFEARANRLARLLRAEGLRHGDHFAVFMENNERYLEVCAAGERIGAYYTCVNSFLTAEEVAYIVDNCEARVLVTSAAKRDVALAALGDCPRVSLVLVVDDPGSTSDERADERVRDYATAIAAFEATPVDDEQLGVAMLYSSGTTGRPKGIVRPLPEQSPDQPLPLYEFLDGLWNYREGMVYLSPAPLYHSAPQAACNLAIRRGATVIVMERFDAAAYSSRPTASRTASSSRPCSPDC